MYYKPSRFLWSLPLLLCGFFILSSGTAAHAATYTMTREGDGRMIEFYDSLTPIPNTVDLYAVCPGMDNHMSSGYGFAWKDYGDSCADGCVQGIYTQVYDTSTYAVKFLVTSFPWPFQSIQFNAETGYNSCNGNDDLVLTTSLSPAVSVSLDPIFSGTIPDFQNWVVDWTGSPPYGRMYVKYGFSSTTLDYQNSEDFSPFISANPLPVTKTQPLWYTPLADPITWYAQAEDIGATSTVSSAIVSFQVSPEASTPAASTSTTLGGFLPVGTTAIPAAGSCSTLTSTDMFGIEMGICNAITFLFVPDTSEQANLGVLFRGLQTKYGVKPPFGYFTAISTALNSFNIESTSSSIFNLNATTTAGFAGVFNPLDLGLAAIIWLLTAFWVFHRARTIQL